MNSPKVVGSRPAMGAREVGMPYKSKAQQGLFHAKEARGEMSKKTVEKWDKESKGKKLPARAKKKK